ncbi:NADPH-dependent F420 reductase [Algoriphagus sediminis]|uniref:NAD(P)-binding domain-containing protein n=1 Tax=Algoriphagus sediminis TaxID=3057113 RepID=A0ABT7YBI2_9BACT|nr:NAD(P)-binding domain-containing protein [Algoriphagus sediminis]MDN3203760.1 NAD(P)-binding domain-containing protein [Algoriphagus sediminis]
MKIGIIGGTSLAKALGKKYLNAGINVVFGIDEDFDTSQPEWRVLNKFYDKLCPYSSAIDQSEIILVCSENKDLPNILESLSKADLDDKIIVDCTNSSYEHQLQSENTALIKEVCKEAPVFKAFNNLGLDYPATDKLGVIKETYYCGDQNPQKNRIKRLIEIIGFKAIDAGKIENATLLEAFYHLRKEIAVHLRQDSNCHFKLVSV